MPPGVGLYVASAFAACAAASDFAPGSGTLDVHPLPVQVPGGTLSPLSSTLPPLLLRREDGAGPVYYLATGLGVPRYGIADLPGAAAWRVVPDADCASLVPVALDEVKQASVQAVAVQQNPLPMACAAAIRYLPEWQRLLLLGVSTGPEGAQGRCIALPPG